jgi:hypothetical protein
MMASRAARWIKDVLPGWAISLKALKTTREDVVVGPVIRWEELPQRHPMMVGTMEA